MKSLDEVVEALKIQKPFLLEKYGVVGLEIFGSYTRNEQTEDSDIDLLVEFTDDKYPSLIKLIGIEHYLEDLLNAKVDLIPKDDIKPRFREKIINSAIVIK